MPTPDSETLVFPLGLDRNYRFLHATCPPDEDRQNGLSNENTDSIGDIPMVNESTFTLQESRATPVVAQSGSAEQPNAPISPVPARSESDNETIVRDTPSPLSAFEEGKDIRSTSKPAIPAVSISSPLPVAVQSLTAFSRPYPLFTSSFLRNGSKFSGTQKSDRQVYNVQVEIKHVDMGESFICGYLRIEGLTADHPTLTTYFEGEIVGNKYAFQTRHPDWGSNEKVDMHHWNLFPSFRPLKAQVKRSDFVFRNFAQKEHVYMRWKEYFLVPDHRVRTIAGASFEGFYYICFNQKTGFIEGFYFHHKSEKHQQLKLDHVADRGCMGAMQLR